MARHDMQNGSTVKAEAQATAQAAFDFMPGEIRHQQRFGGAEAASVADFRTQSKLVDRQVAGLVSRIAAARLREILAPSQPSASRVSAHQPANDGTYLSTPVTETPVLDTPTMFPNPRFQGPRLSSVAALEKDRAALRDAGTALFYFRDDATAQPVEMQRLHPRPLPMRYYDIDLLPPLDHAKAA